MVELYPAEEKLHLFVLNGSGINRLGPQGDLVDSTVHLCGEYNHGIHGTNGLFTYIFSIKINEI